MSVSRKTATISNLVYQYVSTGLTIINGIILVPLYLRHIDYKLYGAWLATGSIIAWLGMVDAGLSEIIRQQTAKVFGAKDFQRAGEVIGTSAFCNCMVGLLPVVATAVIAPFVPKMFGFSGESGRDLSLSFFLAGLYVSLVIISGAASSIQQGLQRNVSVCVIYCATALIGIGVTVAMLQAGFGLISIPMGLVIRNALGALAYWVYTWFFCRSKLGIRLRFSKEYFRTIASLTGWTFIYKVSYEVVNNCDALLIGLILGVEATPVFVLTRRSWSLLRLFLGRIGVAFMPSMAHLYGEGGHEKFRSIAFKLLKTTNYIMIAGTTVCLFLNRFFVNLWVGPDLYAGRLFDFLLALSILYSMFVWTMNQTLYAMGYIKGPAIVGFIQNLTRVLMLLGLIFLWRLNGVIASLVLSCVIIALPYFIKKWKTVLSFPQEKIIRELTGMSFKAAILLGIAYYAGSLIDISTWTAFVGFGLLAGVAVGVLLICIDKQFRDDSVRLLKRIYVRS